MITRRTFLGVASASLACRAGSRLRTQQPLATDVLAEFGYADVELASELHEQQLRNTHAVLMGLSDDSMLKPLRAMAGQPAPGTELGGWYWYNPDYDRVKGDDGFAPACHFGQWVSALARAYAITRDPTTRDKVMRLNRLYARTISSAFYENNRFPAYCYDKLVCGLIDSHELVGDPDAWRFCAQRPIPRCPTCHRSRSSTGRAGDPAQTRPTPGTSRTRCRRTSFSRFRRGAGARYSSSRSSTSTMRTTIRSPKVTTISPVATPIATSTHCARRCRPTSPRAARSTCALPATASRCCSRRATRPAAGGPTRLLRAPGSPESVCEPVSSRTQLRDAVRLVRALQARALPAARHPRSAIRRQHGARHVQHDPRRQAVAARRSDVLLRRLQRRRHEVLQAGAWPCCSGTMPQVAADYRINTYFRDDTGVFVNLYRAVHVALGPGSHALQLTTTTTYPLASDREFELRTSQPIELRCTFAFRRGPTVRPSRSTASAGATRFPASFASVRRTWRSGDRVELTLPMRTRLEPIDAQHPDTVALLWGPLVLFGIAARGQNVTRAQLLAARPTSATSWRAGPITLRPFFAIADEPYTTYFTVT